MTVIETETAPKEQPGERLAREHSADDLRMMRNAVYRGRMAEVSFHLTHSSRVETSADTDHPDVYDLTKLDAAIAIADIRELGDKL